MKKHFLHYSLLIPTVILVIYFSYVIAADPYYHAYVEVNEQGDIVVTGVGGKKEEAYELEIQEDDLTLTINEKNSADYFTIKHFDKTEDVVTIELEREQILFRKRFRTNILLKK